MSTVATVDYPKLRPLDIRPQAQNGQTYLLLRDPLKLSEDSLLVPQPWAMVLAYMDGAHTAADAAKAFQRRFGLHVEAEDVRQLVRALDENYLLDNDRSHEAKQRAVDSYRNAPHRPLLLAGQGYPDNAADLGEFLDSYLAALPPNKERSDLAQAVHDHRFGLLSPHIDFPRGGHVYAQVWHQAAEAVRVADLVILVGTDHYGNNPFTLTRQHYATPYGVLPTAQDIVDSIAGVLGEEEAYAGELRHRGEHSLELVTVWLHHMRGGAPVEIVPMLVGSFDSYIMNGASPDRDPQTDAVLDALRAASRGRRVAVVASGDLSHVGSAFGGEPLSPTQRAAVRGDDEDLIDQMRRASALGFFESIRRVRDRNNVCGVSPVYLTLRLLEATRGELHGYASCPADSAGTSAVTVCGMVFS